jgi:uncharacterized protein (DUF58 family)
MVPLPVVAALDEEQRAAALPHGTRASSSPRAYVPGDDPRHVHWRLTARTGTLMVREREEARQPAVTVLLDTRAAVWDEARFDQAAEVAASVVAANQAGLHPTELLIPGEDGLPPGATSPMDRLAAAEPSAGTGIEALILAAEQGTGGALILITGHAADGIVSRLAGMRRHYAPVAVVELAAGQATVAKPRPDLLVLRAPDAASAVAAWNAMPGWGGGG